MELHYLKYVLEVAKTKSINQAAINLFINQSNLSRDIKKLEKEIGIEIFKRTAYGVELTEEGEKFLIHASLILSEVEKIENIKDETLQQHFSICVPKANYITKAFVNFVDKLDKNQKMEVSFKEASSLGAINEISYNGFNLGMIRYSKSSSELVKAFLETKNIVSKVINSFEYYVAIAEDDPLAAREDLKKEDFLDYLEITHGDPFLPQVKNDDNGLVTTDKVIRVFDSMGQLSMVNRIKKSFMIVYPLDEDTLSKYHLVQKRVEGITEKCFDALIKKKEYELSFLDHLFIYELEKNI